MCDINGALAWRVVTDWNIEVLSVLKLSAYFLSLCSSDLSLLKDVCFFNVRKCRSWSRGHGS